MPKITQRGPTNAAGSPAPLPVEEEVVPSSPPRTGKGSGMKAWIDYAAALGVDVAGLSKAKIISLVG